IVQFRDERSQERCTSRAMNAAAEYSHLEVVSFLHEHRSQRLWARAMDYAASGGYLDIVCFLQKNRWEGCSPSTKDALSAGMNDEACHRHFDIVQIFVKNREITLWVGLHVRGIWSCRSVQPSSDLEFVRMSSRHRIHHVFWILRLKVVTWMSRATCTNTEAKDGNVDAAEVIRFLHEHRSAVCTAEAIDYAAVIGHLEIVRLLHEQRSEGCTVQAMDEAARDGHLEIIRLLHEHR
ncbi:TPA: hypothetical protein N0F65_004602, partial [Lagenidium giganteum]